MNQLAPGPLEAASLAQAQSDALWYKDAVIYQLHVKAFFDSNNDGMGDFGGLMQKLDYIQELGVSAIWLLPFYPSPLKDDGYDVSDYHNVHPQYGTMADFKAFVREAQRRGLKVITELVVNHTSDQHPWFQAARRAPAGSTKRDYYVWSDSDQKYKGTRIIFTDTETSNWAWDPVAKAYYWHRFFGHQPDLNFDNPSVLKAVIRTMRFWLDSGVDGFRLDAIPYLIEREGTTNENLPETHVVLKKIREVIDSSYPNKLLLAEANMWPEDVRPYFGEADECHMAFHFPLMPRMYMAIAQEDRHPLVEIMQQTPEIPAACQWAVFLRNHDELTLEMVTSRERDYMYRTYATDLQARINLGIRRRLAPLMENDPERIRLMNSLLLSMPGSPIVYYGDEIGMGDNIYLGDRNGVRTPMQWSPDRNAGFSRADPQRLFLPPIMDPVYGFESVNVEAQQRDPSSQLNWMKRMLATRKASRAFGRGNLEFLRPGNRKILSYLRQYGDEAILCVANLARTAQPVELDLKRFKGRVPVEMLGRTSFPPIGELPYLLTLPAHGFYWFRLATDAPVPDWHKEMMVSEEAPVLVLFDSWTSFFRDRVVPWRIGMAEKLRAQLENEVLPRFVAAQRWYAAKGEPIKKAPLRDYVIWDVGGISWLLSLVEVKDSSYFLPLALGWEVDEDHVRALAAVTVARVRQQANVGVLADAIADEGFCRHVVKAIGAGRSVPTAHGALRFTRTQAYAELAGDELATLQLGPLHTQSTNTSVQLGERLFLKCYRRLRAGVNPEFEIGRFLTERVHFPHCVPLAGAVEYVPKTGEPDHRRAAAGLRAEPRRRLGLHARLSRALPGARAFPAGAPRRLPGADADARHAHRRAAPCVRDPFGRCGFRARADERAGLRGMEKPRARGSERDAVAARKSRAGKGASAARAPHRNLHPDRRLRRAQGRRPQDAPSRRLPPRAGADRQQRLRDHRFRGRAFTPARRDAAQALAAARRRRHAALLQLRQVERARALHQWLDRRAGRRRHGQGRGARRMGEQRAPRVPQGLRRGDPRRRALRVVRRRRRPACAFRAGESALRAALRDQQPS